MLDKCTPMPCHEPGSPEWLEARRTYIGASEVAAVMGLSPYSTPRDVWMEKTGRSVERETNLAMRAGTFMEPFILAEYEMVTGRKGHKPDVIYRSNSAPWLAVNLDWLSDDGTIVADAKRSEAPHLWGEAGTDDVPDGYFIQMQTQAFVTGVSMADLVALLPRNDLRIYPIMPDAGVQQLIVEATGEFWEKYVKTDTPPPLNEAAATYLPSVKALYNQVEPRRVVLPDPVSITISKFIDVKKQIKELEQEKAGLEALILDHIGNAEAAEVPGRYTLTRKLVEKKPYLCTPKPYTQLRIKEI